MITQIRGMVEGHTVAIAIERVFAEINVDLVTIKQLSLNIETENDFQPSEWAYSVKF